MNGAVPIMNVVVVALAGLAACAVVWLLASPARIAAAALAACLAHPALMLGVTAAATVVVATVGVVVVWRSLAGSGWLLVAVQPHPAGVGGGVS